MFVAAGERVEHVDVVNGSSPSEGPAKTPPSDPRDDRPPEREDAVVVGFDQERDGDQ
jgi:hypothetical protein